LAEDPHRQRTREKVKLLLTTSEEEWQGFTVDEEDEGGLLG